MFKVRCKGSKRRRHPAEGSEISPNGTAIQPTFTYFLHSGLFVSAAISSPNRSELWWHVDASGKQTSCSDFLPSRIKDTHLIRGAWEPFHIRYEMFALAQQWFTPLTRNRLSQTEGSLHALLLRHSAAPCSYIYRVCHLKRNPNYSNISRFKGGIIIWHFPVRLRTAKCFNSRNVREWTHVQEANKPCSHLYSFCVTGDSGSLATRATLTGISWWKLGELITG
jgi:hypothetical protein